MGALLELGSGFHPEYTGRANIDLAATLLGLRPAEIDAKRDEIIAFADIGPHIDEPIKHYSSGMVVRLGFAVATTLSPDILITDEVLAVGDESFQKKCVAWMERYLTNGGTLLMCSHSMYHVQKLCRNALWLREGRAERLGPAADVTQAYLAYHEEKRAAIQRPPQGAAGAAGYYRLRSFELAPAETLAAGSPLAVRGVVDSPDGRAPVVLIGIVRADGTPVYGVATDMDGVAPRALARRPLRFRARVPGAAAAARQVLRPRARARSRGRAHVRHARAGARRHRREPRVRARAHRAPVAHSPTTRLPATRRSLRRRAPSEIGTMTLAIEEVEDATGPAGELFQRTFAHPIPDFPRHFVAFHHERTAHPRVAGYIHYTAWETIGWLCGGLCVDPAAYTRAAPEIAAAWKHAGGIGEIILRDTFARLTDRAAIFGYCGDPRQWQHDLNVGFVPAGPPRLLVRWNRELPEDERARLIAHAAALGPF